MNDPDPRSRPAPVVIDGSPGGSPATAQSLNGLGASIQIFSTASDRIDFYTFTVPAGGATVMIEISQANTALELLLCDAHGNVITDGGGRRFGGEAQIARFLARGRFFIAVGEFFVSDENPCCAGPPAARGTPVGDTYSLSLMLASPDCGGDKPGTGACCQAGHPCELPGDSRRLRPQVSGLRGPLRSTFGDSQRRRPV